MGRNPEPTDDPRDRPEPYEDRKRCRYCGNVIESHPDDHNGGCWAVTDMPDPPEDPRERSMSDMVGVPPDGDSDGQ